MKMPVFSSEPSLYQPIPSHALMYLMDELNQDGNYVEEAAISLHPLQADGADEQDYLSASSITPQDVTGLGFLDGYRRRIRDMQEELPFYGMPLGDYAMEFDSLGLEY